MNDEPWRLYAACAGMDTEMFFPGRGNQPVHLKKLCAACPAQRACLNYALDNEIQHGIWGGLSEKQRRPLRRDRNAARRLALVSA